MTDRSTKDGCPNGHNASGNNILAAGSNPHQFGPDRQASHIPGFYGSSDGPEEKGHGRRVGVAESDSDYVKLSKQGGQKGLLWHEETNAETKASTEYTGPDWYKDNKKAGAETPSPTNSEEKVPRSCPFGSDNKSIWERDSDDKKSGLTAASPDKPALTDEEKQNANKYKKTAHNKNPEATNMSQLLGFGYAKSEKEN